MGRIRVWAYTRAVSSVSAYALLATIWLIVFQQFFDVMAPRARTIIANGPVANTPPCFSPECDFSVFWPAGLLARAGRLHDLYQPDAFLLWRHAILFGGAQRLDWFYPPPALLPVMAISTLPFNAAFAVWTLVFVLAAVLALRWAGMSWAVLALGLASPASLWAIENGQFEILTDAMLFAALMAANKAPWRSGGILGLLVVKPQTALLAPVAMLASGNWRAIAGGFLTALALVAAVTFILGPGVWLEYFTNGLATSRLTLTSNTVGFERGVAVFWMVRSFGGALPICYAAQGLAALAAAALTWLIWRRNSAGAVQRVAMTVFLSLLATPFGYIDDMVAYSFALAALAQLRNWRIGPLDALLWLWPALCPIVFGWSGLLLTPLIVIAAVARNWPVARAAP
jgi:hypothetical protein